MIRRLRKEDAPRAAEIHIFGWRAAYRGIVSDETLFKEMTVAARIPAWEKRATEREEGYEDWESYVYDDGIIKGILSIGSCRDDDKKGSFELGGIYVDPLMKRQGIGKALIRFCENRAKELGFKEILIWVFEANDPSRKFYEAMGYKTDGKTKVHERHGGALEVRYAKSIK